jgi:hypothetical protein
MDQGCEAAKAPSIDNAEALPMKAGHIGRRSFLVL